MLGIVLQAQDISNRKNYIENKLLKIDSLIAEKQYDEAITMISNVENIFILKDTDQEKLAFDFRYAQILYENSEEEKALEKLLKGFEKLKKTPKSHLYIKYVNFLAKVFANSRNFDKAIVYNKIALENAKFNKDTVNHLIVLNRLGSFYYAKNNIDSAKIFYKRITYFPENSKTETRIANAYNNLGVIYQNEGNFILAKARANQALKIKERQKDSLGIAYLVVNLGNLYHYENNYKEAINSYDEAMVSIRNDSTKEANYLKRAIYENLSVSYDSLGDYRSAYQFLIKSRELKDELSNNQLAENIAEVEAKYNISKHEHQVEREKNKALRAQVLFYGLSFVTLTFIVLALIFYKNYKLKQQNSLEQIQNETQTKIINATIDAKEKERKNIAEILHDSVSALLSSANLHIQASKAHLNNHIPPEMNKAQDIIGEASVKIRDLSHELISSVLLKFGLAFAVHDLCQKYSNSKLELISDDNGVKRYNQRFEIKIYNMIEELINNIIKHSRAKNATINLVERNNNHLIIQIIDDGIGFDVKKGRSKNGLGLSHIEARVKVMKGVFNINSKIGEGTSIFISVPIYETIKKEKIA
ncbi:MAG: tetratricopeptide repeat protein [Bacteroidota bacterium]